MCIRDSAGAEQEVQAPRRREPSQDPDHARARRRDARVRAVRDAGPVAAGRQPSCLLYTSDAADDLLCVDFGGRRLI